MGRYHKNIKVEGSDEFELAVNIAGHGAPTESTEAEPGMLYMDTDSADGDLYKCIGKITADGKTTYTWKKMSTGVVYVLKEGETLEDVPEGYALVYDPYAAEPEKDYYTKPEIDTMFGSYVNDIAELIGGEAIADS